MTRNKTFEEFYEDIKYRDFIVWGGESITKIKNIFWTTRT